MECGPGLRISSPVLDNSHGNALGSHMNGPAVSVVIPLFNKETEVGRAIRSALEQTLQDFEIIIVNDGSTDRSADVVKTFSDKRVRTIDQSNAGVSAARNRGIAEARSELVAFLDADDEWKPDFLETIVSLRLRYPSCQVFGTRYCYCSTSGVRRLSVINGISPDMQDGVLMNYFLVAQQSDPPLWTSAVAVTKKAIAVVGGFPVGVRSGEDLLTWARLAARFQIAYSTKPCAIHYNPHSLADRPGRFPQEPDFVGNSLVRLLEQSNPESIPGLMGYIALWLRMRAVIFIQMGDMRKARREAWSAFKLLPSLRLVLILLLTLLPGDLGPKSFAAMKKLKTS